MFDERQYDVLEVLTVGRHQSEEPACDAALLAAAHERLTSIFARADVVLDLVRKSDHEKFLTDFRQRGGE